MTPLTNTAATLAPAPVAPVATRAGRSATLAPAPVAPVAIGAGRSDTLAPAPVAPVATRAGRSATLAPYIARLDRLGVREVARRAASKLTPTPTDAPLRVFTARDFDITRMPSKRQTAIDAATSDPERYVDRVAVLTIGWELYALGGLGALAACCGALSSGGVISYIEAVWDGLGIPGKGVWCR